MLRNLRVTEEMIEWKPSVFALPFALCGAMLARNGLPGAQQLLWIIVAMVSGALPPPWRLTGWPTLPLTRPIRVPKPGPCRPVP